MQQGFFKVKARVKRKFKPRLFFGVVYLTLGFGLLLIHFVRAF